MNVVEEGKLNRKKRKENNQNQREGREKEGEKANELKS
jgi:hypothetical protein